MGNLLSDKILRRILSGQLVKQWGEKYPTGRHRAPLPKRCVLSIGGTCFYRGGFFHRRCLWFGGVARTTHGKGLARRYPGTGCRPNGILYTKRTVLDQEGEYPQRQNPEGKSSCAVCPRWCEIAVGIVRSTDLPPFTKPGDGIFDVPF